MDEGDSGVVRMEATAARKTTAWCKWRQRRRGKRRRGADGGGGGEEDEGAGGRA